MSDVVGPVQSPQLEDADLKTSEPQTKNSNTASSQNLGASGISSSENLEQKSDVVKFEDKDARADVSSTKARTESLLKSEAGNSTQHRTAEVINHDALHWLWKDRNLPAAMICPYCVSIGYHSELDVMHHFSHGKFSSPSDHQSSSILLISKHLPICFI